MPKKRCSLSKFLDFNSINFHHDDTEIDLIFYFIFESNFQFDLRRATHPAAALLGTARSATGSACRPCRCLTSPGTARPRDEMAVSCEYLFVETKRVFAEFQQILPNFYFMSLEHFEQIIKIVGTRGVEHILYIILSHVCGSLKFIVLTLQ